VIAGFRVRCPLVENVSLSRMRCGCLEKMLPRNFELQNQMWTQNETCKGQFKLIGRSFLGQEKFKVKFQFMMKYITKTLSKICQVKFKFVLGLRRIMLLQK